jgi:hypothetical protein
LYSWISFGAYKWWYSTNSSSDNTMCLSKYLHNVGVKSYLDILARTGLAGRASYWRSRSLRTCNNHANCLWNKVWFKKTAKICDAANASFVFAAYFCHL